MHVARIADLLEERPILVEQLHMMLHRRLLLLLHERSPLLVACLSGTAAYSSRAAYGYTPIMSEWKQRIDDVFAKESDWQDDCRTVGELLSSFDNDAGVLFDRAEALLTLVRARGWSRRKTYALFFDQLRDDIEVAHEDVIGDLLDRLCGWCASDQAMRFDGDPEDQNEVAAYARGGTWMHEDRYPAREALACLPGAR